MWAVAVNLNDVLIPHLKKACNLTDLQSSLIQTAFFGAYFVMAIPAGNIMRRFGYGRGIQVGLALSLVGVLLFIGASKLISYPFFLAALFVQACGSATLEVAANPYATVLGPASKASWRLNLAQTFNALGAVLTPLFGKAFILSGIEKTETQMLAMNEAERQSYYAFEAGQLVYPYLALAAVYIILMVVVALARLPEIEAEADDADDATSTGGLSAVLAHPSARNGIIAQFFYVGAQVCLASFMIRFAQHMQPGLGEKSATDYLFYHLLGFAVGRIAGTAIISRIKPERLLLLFAFIGMVLMAGAVMLQSELAIYMVVAAGFFNSIMFPTIFAMAIRGLGALTKPASSLVVMSIVGGALLPALMGYVSDLANIQIAMLVPGVCYMVVAIFAANYGQKRTA